jgi:uncharacterized protein YecE (DUF72 family)
LHGDEELYASGYSDEALDHWANRVKQWSAGKQPLDAKRWSKISPAKVKHRDVFVYFDNDVKVKSPGDAMALAHRLGPAAKGEAAGDAVPAQLKLSKKALAERVRSHW